MIPGPIIPTDLAHVFSEQRALQIERNREAQQRLDRQANDQHWVHMALTAFHVDQRIQRRRRALQSKAWLFEDEPAACGLEAEMVRQAKVFANLIPDPAPRLSAGSGAAFF